jgi:hypothetical protein
MAPPNKAEKAKVEKPDKEPERRSPRKQKPNNSIVEYQNIVYW